MQEFELTNNKDVAYLMILLLDTLFMRCYRHSHEHGKSTLQWFRRSSTPIFNVVVYQQVSDYDISMGPSMHSPAVSTLISAQALEYGIGPAFKACGVHGKNTSTAATCRYL